MQRASVQGPPYPIGLRKEHITEFERLLYIEPIYDPKSSSEYKIKYDSDDSTLFNVTGKEYSNRPVREFRDSSGLPMFETKRPWVLGKIKRPCRVNLPGNDSEDLVDIKLTGGWSIFKPMTLDLTFRNALARDAKTEEDRIVNLQIQKQRNLLCGFAVSVDGRKVADIRESMGRNRTIKQFSPQASRYAQLVPPRAVMEMLVADGVDLSLVRTFFPSFNFGN
jgi:hypothetical protein